MTLKLKGRMNWATRELYTCEHEGYDCSLIIPPVYAVTYQEPHPTDTRTVDGVIKPVMLVRFIRWSTPDDPPFPCFCDCVPCEDWKTIKAEIDGPPLPLPTE